MTIGFRGTIWLPTVHLMSASILELKRDFCDGKVSRWKVGLTLLAAAASLNSSVPVSGATGQQTTPPAAAAMQLEGSLDKAEAAFTGGWAWNAARPSEPIKVDVYELLVLSDICMPKFSGIISSRHPRSHGL